MYYKEKSLEEIKTEIIDQLKNGLVVIENEEHTYDTSESNYDQIKVEAVTEHNQCVVEIIDVSGYNSEGEYITLTEGTDYELWAENGSTGMINNVNNDYNGTILYEGIELKTGGEKFANKSKYYISYKYYDQNKESQITNFSNGTVAKTLVEGISTIISDLYKGLAYNRLQSNVETAFGEGLDSLASNYGLTRREAQGSSGYVTVTNNEENETITISTANVFATEGVNPITFRTADTIQITAGESKTFMVYSTETGADQNVGAGAITVIYTDDGLTSEIDQEYSCTNPAYVEGERNSFNNGTDEENDQKLRQRIKDTLTRKVTARKDTLKNAIESLEAIDYAEIHDWEERKNLPSGKIEVFVIGANSKIISDQSIITEVEEKIKDYKPVGITYIISRPHPVYIDLKLKIFIKKEYWNEKEEIETNIETIITNYIKELRLGEDFKQSGLIKKIMNEKEIDDVIVEDLNFTIYSYDPYNTSVGYKLVDSGTVNKDYAESFVQTTKRIREYHKYDGATYNVAHPTIYNDLSPSVYLAIKDSYNNWVRNPSYAIDFYSSDTFENITVNTTVGGYTLSTTDNLIYDYSYVKYDGIDGIRFFVKVSDLGEGDKVTFKIAITKDDGGYPKMSGSVIDPLVTSDTINLTTNGTQEIEVTFDDHLTLDSGEGLTKSFWLVIKDISVDNSSSSSNPTVELVTNDPLDGTIALGSIKNYKYDDSGSPYWTNSGYSNYFLNKKTFINYQKSKNYTTVEYFPDGINVEADLYSYRPEIIVLKSSGITINSIMSEVD